MNETTRIVEINGVKMEVDMRHARVARVDTLAVGTKVKVLKKGYESHEVLHGVVVGFDAFEKLPSIRIATLKASSLYGSPLSILVFNAETKDTEVLVDDDQDELGMNRETIIEALGREIEEKRIALEKAHHARALFIKHFGQLIGDTGKVPA